MISEATPTATRPDDEKPEVLQTKLWRVRERLGNVSPDQTVPAFSGGLLLVRKEPVALLQLRCCEMNGVG